MTGVPSFTIGPTAPAARTCLQEWRAAVEMLFDVEPLGSAFEASISSYALGPILIGQSSASAQAFSRNEAVIQRSQIDHMMVQLYLRGGFTGQAAGTAIAVEPGDICCFDLAFGFETRAPDFENITMIVPKSTLHPLANTDFFHGLVLRADDTANLLLASHMRELLKLCPTIGQDEIDAVAQVTTEIVRLCLRMPGRQRLAPDAREGSLVDRGEAYIGEHLSDPDLDASKICEVFGVSRPTLYRQFEPLGGVASVIRNWRLSNVFGDLERANGEPFHEIARRNGFANGAGCSRAFKSRYGLSPSAFRRLRFHAPPRKGQYDAPQPGLAQWLRALGKS